MTNYVRKASWSYYDYLQAKEFKDASEEFIADEISDQTRSLIASNNELREEQKQIAEKLTTTVSEGFESVSLELQELNATFNWGFSEILMSLEGINTSLSELIKIAKTPAQTWAYEQFEIARDAYRKGLYKETLEYLDHAINGHESNVGYKLEFRFHYLKGLVQLGSYRNTDSVVLDLSKATKSFLQAARYSQSDYPLAAGQAYLAAGWASYCQGMMDDGLEFIEKAVGLNKNLSEGYFQAAKILMNTNQPNLAIPWLEKAIEKDRRYATKASSDGDFQKYEQDVQKLIDAMRHGAYKSASKHLEHIGEDFSNLQNTSIEGYEFNDFIDRSYERMIIRIRNLLSKAENLLKNNTLYSCLDAQTTLSDAENEINKLENQFKDDKDAQKSIDSKRHHAYQVGSKHLEQIKEILLNLQDILIEGYDFKNFNNQQYEEIIIQIKKLIRKSEKLLKDNTLQSCLDAQSCLSKAETQLNQLIFRSKSDLKSDISDYNSKIKSLKNDIKKINRNLENTPLFSKALIIWTVIIFAWISLVIFIVIREGIADFGEFFEVVFYIGGPLLLLFLIGLLHYTKRDVMEEKIVSKKKTLKKTKADINKCEEIIEKIDCDRQFVENPQNTTILDESLKDLTGEESLRERLDYLTKKFIG